MVPSRVAAGVADAPAGVGDDEQRRALDAEVHKRLGIPIHGGHRALHGVYKGMNTAFDEIAARAGGFGTSHEDQCSAKYYFDMFKRGAFPAIGRLPGVTTLEHRHPTEK